MTGAAPLPAPSEEVARRPALASVLVATDFSPHGTHALERASMLPLAHGARIEVLHVLPEGGQDGDDAATHARSSLEEEREHLVARVAKSTSPRVEASLASGTPWMEIVRAARARGAELIVLGAHSKRGGIFEIGGTAREVIRRGSVPVLVARTTADRPYRTPLVAVDLSDVSRSVVGAALLVTEPDVPLCLLHAFHVPFEGFVAQGSSRRALADFRRHYREEARRQVSELALAIDPARSRCAGVVRQGEAGAVVTREIAKRTGDLVVVGTHGRTGLSHFVLGSVAQWLLDHVPCDVLVARPERFPLEPP